MIDPNALNVCERLEILSDALKNSSHADTDPTASHGWQYPSVSFTSMAAMCQELNSQIRQSSLDPMDDDDADLFDRCAQSLQSVINNTIPRIDTHPVECLIPIYLTLIFVQSILSRYLGWTVSDRSKIPAITSRRLASMKRQIDEIVVDKDDLLRQLNLIKNATDAADNLPIAMEELTRTQSQVRKISSVSSELLGTIKDARSNAQHDADAMAALAEEAKKYIDMAAEAHRTTTSAGLAAAFEERANRLNVSLRFWVAWLALSLVVAIGVGYYRLEAMKDAMSANTFDGYRVWTHIILTAVGLAAPVWFAWISTKQISHLFKLSEDYAFKASVAKAYEGYRRAAAQISAEFEQTLFASALKRLDEAPLRMIDPENHGSPLHELANSKTVDKLFSALKRKPPSTIVPTSVPTGRPSPKRPIDNDEVDGEPKASETE